MESKRLVIKSKSVGEIVNYINNDMKEYTIQPSDNIRIFMSEKYYFRNNTQLMTSLIFKIKDENNCVIDIIAGGGDYGLFSSDWGAKKSRIKEIEDEIKSICMDKGWEMNTIWT
ncbi:hypothetical protein [Tissierella praeacuta]|uniref:hypothetical protein n=1 Tax=Tissierella praeacuta TaxID=43131 RepID=UPI00333F55F4